MREVEVRSLEDCLELIQAGDKNRATAFTALNAASSRSHAVLMLTVVKRTPLSEGGDLQRVRVGKLFMVDLAGSERLKKSGSTGGWRWRWSWLVGMEGLHQDLMRQPSNLDHPP